MSNQKIKSGQPIKIELSTRYFQFNRQYAVRDVFDALVELLTNSDDSYHRMFIRGEIPNDGGQVLVEYQEQRGGEPSLIRIRDRAEGMNIGEMINKFGNVGKKTSNLGDRGFMARGAKDCTELGEMTVESIKGGKFYSCKLTKKPELIPLEVGRKVKKEDREQMGILRGNGTTVSLLISPNHRLPRISTLIRDLPWHFALRDITSEESPTKILIINVNDKNSSPEPIVYRRPKAECIIDGIDFDIEGYPEAKATLTIYRSDEPLNNPGDRRFKRAGLLVKGERAIHECTLIRHEFENDPLAKKYYGEIKCEYIDHLMNRYDNLREKGEEFPHENPRLVIDPNRQHGLIKDHPFTRALFQVPSERLRSLLAKDREAQKKEHREIANKETKDRLKKLAKAASNFMREQLEDLGELSVGEDVDPKSFTEKGIMIVPTYIHMKIGDQKKIWLYVHKDLIKSDSPRAIISCENEDLLEINDKKFDLEQHLKKPDRFFGTFTITAKGETDATYILANIDGSPNAEAIVEIDELGIEIRDFSEPLEFEHGSYSIKEGKTRTIRLFALYPDLVSQESPVQLNSSDSKSVAIRGSYSISPITGTNYAFSEIRVEGRRLQSTATITANVNGRETSVPVKVVQKRETGVPLEIEIRDEDFYNYRARWADHEGKPNLLLISGQHKSLKRYLGPPPDFEGQNTPIFRMLLAEIIAESVCRKVLLIDASEHPWDYRLADLKDDNVIVDEVLTKLHSRIRDFVSHAHQIMLSDTELKQKGSEQH